MGRAEGRAHKAIGEENRPGLGSPWKGPEGRCLSHACTPACLPETRGSFGRGREVECSLKARGQERDSMGEEASPFQTSNNIIVQLASHSVGRISKSGARKGAP
ncbi:unnamed protein product [Natator depressus]